jgi:hypothetical protein
MIKVCMKMIGHPLIGLSFALLCAGGSALESGMESVYKMQVSGVQVEYRVPQARLGSGANRWDHRFAKFPVEIGDYAERARVHLIKAKKIQKPVRLTNMIMSQHLGSWYFVFSFGFDVANPRGGVEAPLSYTVVMLFDGTIAEELEAESAKPRKLLPTPTR